MMLGPIQRTHALFIGHSPGGATVKPPSMDAFGDFHTPGRQVLNSDVAYSVHTLHDLPQIAETATGDNAVKMAHTGSNLS
jgi:hypothetical protein